MPGVRRELWVPRTSVKRLWTSPVDFLGTDADPACNHGQSIPSRNQSIAVRGFDEEIDAHHGQWPALDICVFYPESAPIGIHVRSLRLETKSRVGGGEKQAVQTIVDKCIVNLIVPVNDIHKPLTIRENMELEGTAVSMWSRMCSASETKPDAT